jgi:phthalate 4,5-cis-dihydrodiol dehydrogenase
MRKLKVGAVGLGRAFALMAPTLRDPRVEMVAAADPRPEARRQFERDFGGRAFATMDELCKSDAEVIYIATPHQFHAGQAVAACRAGKHVLVEKPMALTLADCQWMTEAAEANRVHVLVGHSHSFDAPIARTRQLIDSGDYGRVRMITALNYTDYLYRPRRPEELDTAKGGGAVYNQAAHQVDVARLLGGGLVESVRALTGAWDPARPTEGAFACLLRFKDNAFASLAYSGYAHFDSDELMGWIGEGGQRKDAAAYGAARRALRGDEAALKAASNYGGPAFKARAAEHHPHFGPLVVSCDRADLRPLPEGVMIYADGEKRLDPLPAPGIPRAEVIDELYAAVVDGKPPLHDGRWATATTEVLLAMLESAPVAFTTRPYFS